MPIKHEKSELTLDSENEYRAIPSNDIFIYNPYSPTKGKSSATAPTTLVCQEPVYFDLILANPFTFELDIQALTIRTDGVPFKSISVSTTIPPETRVHTVRVSGSPQDCGKLSVLGCTARMLSGSVEEKIDPVEKYRSGKRVHQTDRDRMGKSQLVTPDKKASDIQSGQETPWLKCFHVIPELPLIRGQLGLKAKTGAMMLLQGEMYVFIADRVLRYRTSIPLIVGNVGNVPVNYMTVSISETIDEQCRRAESVLDYDSPEAAYERDVFDHSTRAFWVSKDISEVSPVSTAMMRPNMRGTSITTTRVELDLQPGDSHTIKIGVYGKLYCNGCTFKVEYGYLDERAGADVFYTRQLFLPLLVAVQTALKVQNPDILLFGKEIKLRDSSVSLSAVTGQPLSLKGGERRYSLEEMMVDPFGFSADKQTKNQMLIKNIPVESASEYCLLTFDLKNVWSHMFEVVFRIHEGSFGLFAKSVFR